MNCPNCGAAMRLEEERQSFRCEYCATVYVPPENDEGIRVFGEETGSHCPVCRVPLVRASMYGYSILYCRQCQGVLIAMSVFVTLVDHASACGSRPSPTSPPGPREFERRLECPTCRKHMDAHFYGGPGNVLIDTCSSCCLNWFDGAELQRVLCAASSTGNRTRSLLPEKDLMAPAIHDSDPGSGSAALDLLESVFDGFHWR